MDFISDMLCTRLMNEQQQRLWEQELTVHRLSQLVYHKLPSHGETVQSSGMPTPVCHDKTLDQQCMLTQARPPMINHLTSTVQWHAYPCMCGDSQFSLATPGSVE